MAGQLDLADVSLEIVPGTGPQLLLADVALEIVSDAAGTPPGTFMRLYYVMVAGVPVPIYFDGIMVNGVLTPIDFLGIQENGTPTDPYTTITI